VIPLRAATDWLAPRRPVAMLFINDPERPNNPTAERLQKVFGLTRTEGIFARSSYERTRHPETRER
jgi:hypothetical protein